MKRSSNDSTGTSRTALERGDELRRLLRLRSALAAQRQRQADDDQLGPLRRDELGELAQARLRGGALDDADGRASVPVASETATPVRAEP